MQLKCAWCMKDRTCDMGEGEDCPDFQLQPQFAPHVIRSSILEVYPEITQHVEVVWTKGAFAPSFTITIVLKKLLTVFERAELVTEVEQNLNELNKGLLHMEDGDFTVHVAQAVEHSAEVPEGVDEDGTIGLPVIKSTPCDGPNPLKEAWDEWEDLLYCPPDVETATGTYDPAGEGGGADADGPWCAGCGMPKSAHRRQHSQEEIHGGLDHLLEHPEYEEETISLPPGWESRRNKMVGYDFLYKGEIRLQHPCDDTAIRKMVWRMHEKENRPANWDGVEVPDTLPDDIGGDEDEQRE